MQEKDRLALLANTSIVWQPSFSFESPDSKYCSGITSPIFSVLGKKGQDQPRPTQGPVLAEIGPFVPTKPSHWGGTLFSVPPLLLTVLIKKIPALMNYYQGSQHTIGRGCLLMDLLIPTMRMMISEGAEESNYGSCWEDPAIHASCNSLLVTPSHKLIIGGNLGRRCFSEAATRLSRKIHFSLVCAR